MKAIGPNFRNEIAAAGLLGLPFVWEPTGEIRFDAAMTQAQCDAVMAVYAAHDPAKPAPPPVVQPSAAKLSAQSALATVQADVTVSASAKAAFAAIVAAIQ